MEVFFLKYNFALFAAGILLAIAGASLEKGAGAAGWLVSLAGVALFISGFYNPSQKTK